MIFRFADCELDTSRHVLLHGGAPVHVEPQVFDLLVLLAESGPDLVSYDALVERIWAGRIVSDATLASRVSAARSAIGDSGAAQAVIRTVPRRGIQLVVPVVRGGADRLAGAGASEAQPNGSTRQVIRFATSRDGTSVAFAVSGEGPPLLRGGHWLSHLEKDWESPVWRPLLDRLGAGRRLVRYDPRGTGLSSRSLGEPTVESFADDLEAVADAAELDRFPIFAVSQSVPIALAFAARSPQRVSRMVLVGGFAQGSTARGERARTEAMVELIRSGWGDPESAFVRAFAQLYMPAATREEFESFVAMQVASASPEVAARLRAIIGDIDVTGILDRIETPALVLHARGDAVQDPSQGRLLASRLRAAEFRLLETTNHVPVPSDPAWQTLLREAERFLGEDG